MRMLFALGIGAVLFLQQVPPAPLRVAGNTTTIELSPVLVAANGIYPGPITVSNGGIPNIVDGTADVTIVSVGATDMATALKDRRVDAVAMWEPESQRAIDAVEDDAIVLQDRKVYRELFNLNTSTKVLADPARHRATVEFVRALITTSERLRSRPQEFWPYISMKLNYPPELVSKSWPELRYAGSMVSDLLDVLEQEEPWVARERNRPPRTRAQLALLIDDSVLKEALAR